MMGSRRVHLDLVSEPSSVTTSPSPIHRRRVAGGVGRWVADRVALAAAVAVLWVAEKAQRRADRGRPWL